MEIAYWRLRNNKIPKMILNKKLSFRSFKQQNTYMTSKIKNPKMIIILIYKNVFMIFFYQHYISSFS